MASMMSAVAMMEKVHQRTGEQKQVWKSAHQMGLVLGPQEVRGYRKKTNQDPLAAARSSGLVMVVVSMHLRLPVQVTPYRIRQSAVAVFAHSLCP